jgi:hypothetical protein
MLNRDAVLAKTVEQIRGFAKENPDEKYHAFAIDGTMLCFLTQSQIDDELETVRAKSPGFSDVAKLIQVLKSNTGDWLDQGFGDLAEDFPDYAEGSDDYASTRQKRPAGKAYAETTEWVIAALAKHKVIADLSKTPEFSCFWVKEPE